MRHHLIAAVGLGLALASTAARADTTVVVDNKSAFPITAQVDNGAVQGLVRGLTSFELKTNQMVTVFSARPVPPNGKICDHKSVSGTNFIKLEVADSNGRPGCGASRGF